MSSFCGIDVGAQELTVAVVVSDQKPQHSQFEQTPEGHKKLVKYLKKRKIKAVVMEATGIYFIDAAMALHRASLPVSVINPRAAHHFAKAILQTTKTDRVDAVTLAEYASRMELIPWRPPSVAWLTIRDLGRRINQLTGNKTAAKNRLHALKAKAITDSVLIKDVESEIRFLEGRIKRLSSVAAARIKDEPALQSMFDIMTDVKGIAEASALAILSELCLLDPSLKSPQVSRYAGLDVRLRESGTSLHGKPRLSKCGNAYLRSAMYMPVLSLVQHDPIAKAHYQHLQERGKAKLQALCAIQRKLLTGLWACIRSNEPFESSKLFAIRPQEA